MEQMAPAGPIYQAGTLSGNPLATAAGLATLGLLRENPDLYDRLEETSELLEEGLAAAIRDTGAPCSLTRVGSMMGLFFTPGPVRDWDSAAAADTEAFGRYFQGMLERGIYVAPSAFEAGFVSTAHDMTHVDRTVDAAREVLGSCF